MVGSIDWIRATWANQLEAAASQDYPCKNCGCQVDHHNIFESDAQGRATKFWCDLMESCACKEWELEEL